VMVSQASVAIVGARRIAQLKPRASVWRQQSKIEQRESICRIVPVAQRRMDSDSIDRFHLMQRRDLVAYRQSYNVRVHNMRRSSVAASNPLPLPVPEASPSNDEPHQSERPEWETSPQMNPMSR